MYTSVSEAFKAAISKNNQTRSYKCNVTYKNSLGAEVTETLDASRWEMSSTQITDGCLPGSYFQLGGTVARSIKTVLKNDDGLFTGCKFGGGVLKPYFGLYVDGAFEWIPVGTYVIDSCSKTTAKAIEISGCNKFLKGEKLLSDCNIVFPTTLANLLQACANEIGVTLATTSFSNSDLIMNEPSDKAKITIREIIGGIAAVAGGYAYINYSDELEIRSFTLTNPITLDGSKTRYSVDVGEINTIDSAVYYGSERNFLKGDSDGKYPVSIEQNSVFDNLAQGTTAITQILNTILTGYKGFNVVPVKVDFAGDPRLQAGDPVYLPNTADGDITTILTSITMTVTASSSAECVECDEIDIDFYNSINSTPNGGSGDGVSIGDVNNAIANSKVTPNPNLLNRQYYMYPFFRGSAQFYPATTFWDKGYYTFEYIPGVSADSQYNKADEFSASGIKTPPTALYHSTIQPPHSKFPGYCVMNTNSAQFFVRRQSFSLLARDIVAGKQYTLTILFRAPYAQSVDGVWQGNKFTINIEYSQSITKEQKYYCDLGWNESTREFDEITAAETNYWQIVKYTFTATQTSSRALININNLSKGTTKLGTATGAGTDGDYHYKIVQMMKLEEGSEFTSWDPNGGFEENVSIRGYTYQLTDNTKEWMYLNLISVAGIIPSATMLSDGTYRFIDWKSGSTTDMQENNRWLIDGILTEATVENVITGTGSDDGSGSGSDGVGIQSIEQTTTSTADGGTNVITCTLTDGTTSNFEIKNGSQGSAGSGSSGSGTTFTNMLKVTADGVVTYTQTDAQTPDLFTEISDMIENSILGGAS